MNQLERYVNSLLTVTGNYTINDTKYIPDGTNFSKKLEKSLHKPPEKYTFKQFFEDLRDITEEDFKIWSEDLRGITKEDFKKWSKGKYEKNKEYAWKSKDKLETSMRLFAALGILQRVYNDPPASNVGLDDSDDQPKVTNPSRVIENTSEQDDQPESDNQPNVTDPTRVINLTSNNTVNDDNTQIGEQGDVLSLSSLNTQTSSEIYEIIRDGVETVRFDSRGRRIIIEAASDDSDNANSL